MALTLVACWASPPDREMATETAAPERESIVITPADESMRALLLDADAAWESLGAPVDAIVVAAVDTSGTSRWLVDTLGVGAACDDAGHNVDACATYPGLAIVAAATLDDTRARVAVLHEMGHLLHGLPDNTHLDGCPVGAPGDSVMCPGGAAEPILTTRDLDFILQ